MLDDEERVSRVLECIECVQQRFCAEPKVFGFSGELRQLFANLIGNAIDAMSNGGTLALRIWRGHGARTDGASNSGVRISITDTGVGMAEETQRRIFEAFFTTKEATGTGLGLWISEEIVRKHSGTIKFRSRQGERSGTSFLLFFPDAVDTTLSEARKHLIDNQSIIPDVHPSIT
jgi:signal transduction histidine kinase